jgi:hypothetical protein
MKYKVSILIFAITCMLISCRETDSSDSNPLLGTWLEVTPLMDQEGLTFTESDTLRYATRSRLKYVSLQEFLYDLNGRHTELYLWPVEDPGRKITCNITLNSALTEFTITGLMKNDPDGSQRFVKVVK